MHIEIIKFKKSDTDQTECVSYRLDSDNDEPLTLSEIIDYLYMVSDRLNTFRPYMMPYSRITNESYNPDEYSEEIEQTEQDMLKDELCYIIRHCGMQNPDIFNSDTWKNNHAKKCKVRLEIPQLMMAACYNRITEDRNFGGPSNIDIISKWFNELESSGLHVYSFMLI